jgi:putative FmdB family regulatory protein
MPIYEYKCIDCGDSFEKMVRFTESDQDQACPSCNSLNTKKKISAFASLGNPGNENGGTTGNNCGSSGGFS